jgi:hypothetical protein
MEARLAEIEEAIDAIDQNPEYQALLDELEQLRGDIADLEEDFDNEDDPRLANRIVNQQHRLEVRAGQIEERLAQFGREALEAERDRLQEEIDARDEAREIGRDPKSGGGILGDIFGWVRDYAKERATTAYPRSAAVTLAPVSYTHLRAHETLS